MYVCSLVPYSSHIHLTSIPFPHPRHDSMFFLIQYSPHTHLILILHISSFFHFCPIIYCFYLTFILSHIHPPKQIIYDPFLFNISGAWEDVDKYGDWFTWTGSPRAQIFARSVCLSVAFFLCPSALVCAVPVFAFRTLISHSSHSHHISHIHLTFLPLSSYFTFISYSSHAHSVPHSSHSDQSKVTDVTTMQHTMRYNNFKLDPLSACNCTPPYRYDLIPHSSHSMLIPFSSHTSFASHFPYYSTFIPYSFSFRILTKPSILTSSHIHLNHHPTFIPYDFLFLVLIP